MTKPEELKVGDVASLLDDNCVPKMRGLILAILPNNNYRVEDNVYFKKWTYHRSELRKLPDRKEGA